MPWMETSPVIERWKFVEQAVKRERSFVALCRDAGISRETGYKWLRRFQEKPGFEALKDRSRAPVRSPTRTPSDTEARILALRKEFSSGGVIIARKLAEESIRISPRTVDRVLSRTGCVRDQDRPQPAPRRFQRAAPNQLWQMDFKGPIRVGGSRGLPLTILDDHSRFLLSLRGHRSTDAASVRRTLEATFREYGLPDAMLMDHGTPWWSTTNAQGLTWLSVWLIELGIRLIYSGIRHPQTQGKVERLHRTLQRWLDDREWCRAMKDLHGYLREFREIYNHKRPHSALDYRVPAAAYSPSETPFHEPRPWTYPEGADVRRVNCWGAVHYQRRLYFICDALIGKEVMLRELEGIALVIFRHMTIRELNLRTHHTRPVIEGTNCWPTRDE